MKKMYSHSKAILALFVLLIAIACSQKTAPVATEEKVPYDGPKVTFAANIEPIMKRSCAPCHFPSEGGKKEALETYEQVKDELEDVLGRVQLPESNMKFMPKNQKKPSLSPEEIEMLKNWARGGFLES